MTDEEKAAIALMEEIIGPSPKPYSHEVPWLTHGHIRLVLDALARETARADEMQTARAKLFDELHGTPCAQIAWAQERDALHTQLAKAAGALKGVIRVADRNTDEFDVARVVLAEITNLPTDHREKSPAPPLPPE